MKLAARYQRTNLLVTIIIFLVAGAAFYLLLHRVLLFQVDEDLEIEQHEIQTYVSRFKSLPENVVPVEDQVVRYEKTSSPIVRPIQRTVVLWDEVEKERGDFRQLIFTVNVGAQCYKISVSKSLEGTEGLTHQIGLIASGIIALMLLISFLVNHIVLRHLWKPFYVTIEKLRFFKIGDKEGLRLPGTTIEEFALLNNTLEATTGKAAQDYQLLKEFTENASHELQTPLAILRSKLDLFIQDETLSENQSDIIQTAYHAIRRMTHLNQSLLMLAKIEAGQYGEQKTVDMKMLLEEKLSSFETFIQEKEIVVETAIQPAKLLINRALAEILLNNLLSNAINHNQIKGKIKIELNTGNLTVCNTSIIGELAPEKLFNRFYKTTPDVTRTGLGLAIAKQVCTESGCIITYSFCDNMHCFTIGWNAG